MKIKSFLQLIILFFGIFCYSAENASALTPQAAEQWAKNKGEQILQILSAPSSAQKYEQLDAILSQDIDLDHAARFVVGKYWRQMTPEQQAEYVPLFKRYVSALYKSVPLDIKTDSKLPQALKFGAPFLLRKLKKQLKINRKAVSKFCLY